MIVIRNFLIFIAVLAIWYFDGWRLGVFATYMWICTENMGHNVVILRKRVIWLAQKVNRPANYPPPPTS